MTTAQESANYGEARSNLDTEDGQAAPVFGNSTLYGKYQDYLVVRQVHGIIHSLCYQHLDLTHPHILRSMFVQPDDDLWDLMVGAADRGDIPRNGIGDLLEADLLLRARLPDSTEQVHVAVEVSRTVADDDIVRARERADLLAAAAGTAGQGVVIGVIIPEPQRRLAERMGVAIFQEEEPRP